MCSINGFINFNSSLLRPYQVNQIKKKIEDIVIKAEDRGRDSFGYACFSNIGVRYFKSLKKSSDYIKEIGLTDLTETKIFISNNRAEPTTEFIEKKNEEDVHPFFDNSGKFFIVHNGTIANDKDLEKKYNLKRSTKIDSAIIPELLNVLWKDKKITTLCTILREEIVGSYSLAIVDKDDPDTLYLATNYKPLFIQYDKYLQTLFFSSLESYLDTDDYNNIFGNESIREVKPYTLLKIKNGNIEEYSLYNKDYEQTTKKQKALIIASSGLDSTVCASWAKKQGYNISLLHFKYKCRAEEAEGKAIRKIKEFFNCDLVEIPLDFYKDIIGGSRLFEENSLVKDGNGEASAELAWEWVPARNLVFFSLAAAYAEAHGFDYIVLGGNLEEGGNYCDNELIFQKKFNDILPNALNLQNKVQVLTPVANLMKWEIVKLGLKIGAPLDITWSCYENAEIECGNCGPDFMRKVAFKMNKVIDPKEYRFMQDNFWDNCKKIKLINGEWISE